MCLPGFYSTGGKPDNPRPVCKPCGLHFTSPPGAISAAYCACEAGFGSGYPSDPLSEFTCELCPIGSYNPGPGISNRHIAAVDDYGGGGYSKKKRLPRGSPCRPCNGGNRDGDFTTLDVGAKSVQQCVCAPGHGGPQCDPCQSVSVCVCVCGRGRLTLQLGCRNAHTRLSADTQRVSSCRRLARPRSASMCEGLCLCQILRTAWSAC